MSATTPPLGVMPRWRWLELRAADLSRAILEYTEASPSERTGDLIAQWGEELSIITVEIVNEDHKRASST